MSKELSDAYHFFKLLGYKDNEATQKAEITALKLSRLQADDLLKPQILYRSVCAVHLKTKK